MARIYLRVLPSDGKRDNLNIYAAFLERRTLSSVQVAVRELPTCASGLRKGFGEAHLDRRGAGGACGTQARVRGQSRSACAPAHQGLAAGVKRKGPRSLWITARNPSTKTSTETEQLHPIGDALFPPPRFS